MTPRGWVELMLKNMTDLLNQYEEGLMTDKELAGKIIDEAMVTAVGIRPDVDRR